MYLDALCKALIWLSISMACKGQPESRWVRGGQKINFFPEIILSGGGAEILILEFANGGGGLHINGNLTTLRRSRLNGKKASHWII